VSPVVTRGLAQRNILEDPEQMRTLAEQAAEELADAPAEEVIRWAVDTFGERICVTSSMTDAVIIHLAAAVQPGIDVDAWLDGGGEMDDHRVGHGRGDADPFAERVHRPANYLFGRRVGEFLGGLFGEGSHLLGVLQDVPLR